MSKNEDPNRLSDKTRRNAFIKMTIMLVFVVLCIAFGSIAWFTFNKQNSAGGMGVKIGAEAYQIVPVEGNASIFQEYYDYMNHRDQNALVWNMTDEANMENYTGDAGISPGSYGMISFYVHPRDESINLDLSFSIVGYEYHEADVTAAATEDAAETEAATDAGGAAEEPTEATTQPKMKTMTEVDDDLQKYLAGHIFLFQNREPVYDKPEETEGRKIVSYKYSDPILSGNDLSKVIRNRAFTKANQNTAVNIYWVWPKTLSTLVDATANANVIIVPFSSGTDKAAIVTNIANYPSYYFYQYTETLSGNAEEVEGILSSGYDTYGDLYDRVDNEIGMKVSYITLKLTSREASQATAATASETTETTTAAATE